MNETLLQVENLSVRFDRYTRGLARHELPVIESLDVTIKAGEVAAIVGSSGSGKSLLANAILGILPSNARVAGTIYYKNKALDPRRLDALRGGEIALIPQSLTSLDPCMPIGKQVMGTKYTKDEALAVFRRYKLAESVMDKYPFELSGGMARRVLIAAAVITGAKLIIADEPTPGLSEALAGETLSHLRELADSGCGVLLITHDINLALRASDTLTIFYAGMTVETAAAGDFAGSGEQLRHPYTKALWRALPQNDFSAPRGFQPYAGTVTSRCSYYERCGNADAECLQKISMRAARGGKARCVHVS